MNRKLISLILIVSIMTAFTMPVIALEPVTEANHPLKQKYTVTEAEKEKFNPYVSLDEETLQYFIINDARSELTEAEYLKLSQMIDQTNSFIKTVDFEKYGDEIFVILNESESFQTSISETREYVEGVTKIDVHWWGYTVYLSKTTLNTIGLGVDIAGIFIKHPVVSVAAGILGFALGYAPGGIVFDYNTIVAAIPGIGIVLEDIIFVTSVRFQ